MEREVAGEAEAVLQAWWLQRHLHCWLEGGEVGEVGPGDHLKPRTEEEAKVEGVAAAFCFLPLFSLASCVVGQG